MFDVLSPDLDAIGEESEKFREVKTILDAQMDALTEAEMVQLIFTDTCARHGHQGPSLYRIYLDSTMHAFLMTDSSP